LQDSRLGIAAFHLGAGGGIGGSAGGGDRPLPKKPNKIWDNASDEWRCKAW